MPAAQPVAKRTGANDAGTPRNPGQSARYFPIGSGNPETRQNLFPGALAAIAVKGGPAAVIGTRLARPVGKHHKDHYQEQIERGGIALRVRVADIGREDLASRIVTGHSGRDGPVQG